MKNKNIIVYGAKWCYECHIAKAYFDQNNIKYHYIDLEMDPAAVNEVERINNGLQSIPTIIFEDGSILVEPSVDQLRIKLEL